MTANNSCLKMILQNGFNWTDDSPSCISMLNGSIILLPYELNNDDTNHIDKQSACILFIESISKPNKIFFITTNKYSSTIVPLIYQYRQIDSIFILTDRNESFEYDENCYKIIGYYHNEKDLIDSINEQINLEKQQRLSFSFYNQYQKSTRNLSKESASFLWLLLFKDIIVRMRYEYNHEQGKHQLTEQLKQIYRNNRVQLKLIEHFNQTYKITDNEPLRWYTSKPFLHKQINRALRTEDIQMLHIFRYIISDISYCLKQEFELIKEYVDHIIVYRGLRITNQELNQLKENIGQMISTNGYLSTSRSRSVALIFAGKSAEDKQSVLFEIECNLDELQNDSVIFADISRFSEIRDEDEILFDLGATFIMEKIFYDQELNIWIVNLKSTDEPANIGKFYLERNQQFIENTSVTLTFGILLHMMGQYTQALNYFQSLLSNSTEDKGFIQFSIGIAQFELGNYVEAFRYLEQARTIFESYQPSKFFPEINSYMGYILSRMGNHDEALKVHIDCLTFVENRMKHNPQYISVCLGRIGNVYFDKCEYNLAMNYYMKANHLLVTCCSSDHIELGKNLGNIGSVYYAKGDIDQALIYYEEGLKILEKYLIPDHTQIIVVLNNLANIRRDYGDYSDALKYFNKCLSIEMQVFPEGHIDIVSTLNQIGQLFYFQDDYDQCLEYYFKALNMCLDLKNDNHIDYAMTLYNIGYAYAKIRKDFDLALNYARQALQIIENNQLITTNTGGKCLLLVGSILHLQDDANQALEFVLKALEILKNVYKSQQQQQHQDIALCLTQLGDIYLHKNMFNLALEVHQQALTIREHFIEKDLLNKNKYPLFRYKDIADCLINIANIYFKMNEIELALNFYSKSLIIKQIYFQSSDYEQLIIEIKSIAQALAALEKWDDALTCYMQIDTIVLNNEEKTLNLTNIGQCYKAKKNYFLALDYYRQALAIVDRMDMSNPIRNTASIAIKQDIDEMICECVVNVFIEHGHHFHV